jgi:hypothetical protein
VAKAWICDECGSLNSGDLCPGCAKPRPINVAFRYIGNPEGYKEIDDGLSGSSSARGYALLAILLLGPFLFTLLLTQPVWIAAMPAGIAVLILIWNFGLVKPKLVFYRFLQRSRQRR